MEEKHKMRWRRRSIEALEKRFSTKKRKKREEKKSDSFEEMKKEWLEALKGESTPRVTKTGRVDRRTKEGRVTRERQHRARRRR